MTNETSGTPSNLAPATNPNVTVRSRPRPPTIRVSGTEEENITT